MVDKEDMIYVETDDTISLLGDGFSSEDEIITEIKKRYETQLEKGLNIKFGVCEFEELSDTETEKVSIPRPNNADLSPENEEVLTSILERADSDRNVEFAKKLDRRRVHATKYEQSVRYKNAVDFVISFKTDLFDSVPINSSDTDQVDSIKRLFNDLVRDSEAMYLGFSSGYTGRGRRNPHVEAFGRVHRDTEKETHFKQVLEKEYVIGHHWNDLNISPVPVYWDTTTDSEAYREQDYILVLDKTDATTSVDEISEDVGKNVINTVKDIEDETDFRISWIGKINHYGNFNQICIGISFEPDM